MQVDLGGADRKLAWDPSFARCALGETLRCFLPLPASRYAAVLVLIRSGRRSFAARRESVHCLSSTALITLEQAMANGAVHPGQACSPPGRGAWCSGAEMRFDRMNPKRSPHRIQPISQAKRSPLFRQPPIHLSSEFAQILPIVAHATSCRSVCSLLHSRRGSGTLNRRCRLARPPKRAAVAQIGILTRAVEVDDSRVHLRTMHGRIDWSLDSISAAVFPDERPPGTVLPIAVSWAPSDHVSTPILDTDGVPLV